MIELKNINKYYGGAKGLHVLRHVTLRIESGEFCAITGASGSGKSTLMNILGCLDMPDGGVYRLDGKNITAMSEKSRAAIRNRDIGFIFQSFNLIPALTAEENVMLPLMYRRMKQSARRELAQKALGAVGMSHRTGHKPYELSGGQQQRVAIARAIAAKPPVILADEPTGSLDRSSGEAVLEALLRLNETGRTVILVTHDQSIAKAARREIKISDGTVAE